MNENKDVFDLNKLLFADKLRGTVIDLDRTIKCNQCSNIATNFARDYKRTIGHDLIERFEFSELLKAGCDNHHVESLEIIDSSSVRCSYIGSPYHSDQELRCLLKSGHEGKHFFYCPNRSVPYIFREDWYESGVEVYADQIFELLDESVKEFVL